MAFAEAILNMLDSEFTYTSKYRTLISTSELCYKYRQSSDADSAELAYQAFWWLVLLNNPYKMMLGIAVSSQGILLYCNLLLAAMV